MTEEGIAPKLRSGPTARSVETLAMHLYSGRAMSARSEVLAAPATEDSDEALMQAYASGRAAAFDVLYARHKGGLYRYVLRHCGNAGIADELFQDVWMSAIRARERYVVTAKFTTWLYTLAHHRLIDHWRAGGRAKLVSIDLDSDDESGAAVVELADHGENPESELSSLQLRERLHAALAKLPDEQRDAFLLQHEGGLSLADIAQLTGVALETVKSRLRYAVGKLRRELTPAREEFR
jgi:RNA polymerase sigma-70 factor, ECF subfamily